MSYTMYDIITGYKGEGVTWVQRDQSVQRPWGMKEHCSFKESLAGKVVGALRARK